MLSKIKQFLKPSNQVEIEREQLLESLILSENNLRQANAELEHRAQQTTEELTEINDDLLQEVVTRQQAEVALKETFNLIRQAKQEWEVTVDALPQLVCLIDQEGRVKRVNQTAERWQLVRAGEAVNVHLHRLLHPKCADKACYVESIWNQIKKELDQGHSLEYETDDEILGRTLRFQAQPTPLSAENGAVRSNNFGVVVIYDITTRKQADAEIRESRERYRSLFEESPISIWEEDFSEVKLYLDQLRDEGVSDFRSHFEAYPQAVIDCVEKIKIIDVNQATLDLYQAKSKDELLGSLGQIYTEHSMDLLTEEFIALAEGKTKFRREITVKTMNGDFREVELSLVVASGYDETLSRVLVSIIDITDRRNVEKALRENEERLALAVWGTGGALWDEELKPNVSFEELQGDIYISAEEKKILGYDSDDEDLRTLLDWDKHVFEEDRAKRRKRQQDHFEGRTEILDYEYRITQKDGEIRWVHARSRIIRDDHNQPVRWIGIDWDVTERKLVNERLRQLSLFVEQSPNTVIITDIHGNIEFVNPRFCQITGYTEEEVIGQNPRLLKSGQHTNEFYSELWQAILDKRVWRGELVNRTKTGGIFWELASIAPVKNNEGIITHFVKFSEDISNQKKAESELARYRDHLEELMDERTSQLSQANLDLKLQIAHREQAETELRRSEARFRQVITSISDHIYVTEIAKSGGHSNRYISPNFVTLTGYSAREFLKKWSLWHEQLIHPDDKERAAAQLTQLDLGFNSEVEYRIRRQDGNVIWVRDSATVQPDGVEKVIYGVISNITERKNTEQMLLQYSEQLETLRDIEQGILSAQSVDAICQAAISRIVRLIPCASATITILDFVAGKGLVIMDNLDGADNLPKNVEINLRDASETMDRLNQLSQGQIVTIQRAELKQTYEIVQTTSLGIIMVVPLNHQNELVGTLNLSIPHPDELTEEHQNVALQVADQLAIAIRQADLYQQVQHHASELEQRIADRTRELSTLYEITSVASTTMGIQKMLDRMLEQVLIALRCRAGIIYLANETNREPQVHAQRGFHTKEDVAKVESLLLDNKLMMRVVESTKPVMVPDLENDPRLVNGSGLDGICSYAGALIRGGGHLLGALNIFGETKQQFNIEDLALLASAGDQIGVAVENYRLRQQAEQAAVLKERERLARDLHDSVTQSLYSLTLFSEGSLEFVKQDQLDLVKHNLTRIGETAQQALKEMRLLVYELRPLDLEKEGFVGALHQRLATVEKRAGINARLIAEDLVELSPFLEKELYWITQEALNNILKHAEATQIEVYLRVVNSCVELEIVDNGKGFDDRNQGGLGLIGMQERIKKINGTLEIASKLDKGTTIRVRVDIG